MVKVTVLIHYFTNNLPVPVLYFDIVTSNLWIL